MDDVVWSIPIEIGSPNLSPQHSTNAPGSGCGRLPHQGGADDMADDALQHGKSWAVVDRCGAGARKTRVSAPRCEPSPTLTNVARRIVPSQRRFWNYRDGATVTCKERAKRRRE
jgi:hypothetical protein